MKDDIGKYIDSRRGYNIYRKLDNGKGTWYAIKTEMGEEVGEPFQITYDQARGYAPIDNSEKLGMQIGKMLSNNSRHESILRSSIRRLN